MSSLITLSLFAVFCAFLFRICGEMAPRYQSYLLVGAGILFFLFFAKWLFPLIEKIRELAEKTSVPDFFLLLIKAMGLSLIVSISASFCRDLGEESLAGKLELCGKGAILYLSLPVFSTVLNWIGELLS
jgi:stage III sporulation protein AD